MPEFENFRIGSKVRVVSDVVTPHRMLCPKKETEGTVHRLDDYRKKIVVVFPIPFNDAYGQMKWDRLIVDEWVPEDHGVTYEASELVLIGTDSDF